ncbi:hypothetical protein SAMN04515674_10860 [Pseudarcicella hirudinis]|uniref:Uncharacterized protein n=1 Tax=Pseudarcicella hirudinis TaxID=1079859 RepID=A0A1I5UU05_9BACT|nr:hypothetical protein [Pseudarcicella hirudinis]SFP98794.1 hypothetical protein SAMN04515674_10860 [Pseudarcicella hirudinis]
MIKYSKIFLFYSLILCLVLPSSAQNIKRIEIPLLTSSSEYFTIPLGDNGVILLTQLSKQEFNLVRFDTNLDRIWSINGTIEANLDYVTYSYDGRNLYLLFSRYRSNSYEVIKVNVGPGFVEKFQIYSVDRMEVSDFKAINASVFIAGMVNSQPVILFTSLNERKTKVLPSALKSQAEIQSMEIDTTNNTVNVTYAVGTRGKNYQLVVKSFDEEGKQVSQIVMNPNDEFAMMNGKVNQISDSTQIMFGTYGHKNTIGSSKGPTSQGLYISKLIDNEVLDTKFYSFTDFKNFFNFLTPKQKEKQERKIQDKKDKGEDLRLDYRLLVHDIIRQDGKYILVAEAFYPDYRYQNNYPFGMGGYGYGGMGMFGNPWYSIYNPYRWGYGNYGLYSPFSSYYSPWGYRGYGSYGSQQIFDGWVYTHAVVAAFDDNGKLLWDNSIEMKDVKEPKLIEKVKASINGDEITLSYSTGGKISTKVVKGDKILENTQQKQIETDQEGDKVKKTTSDNIDFWYGKYFLASGYQKISNDNEGAKRNVFFLSKISF